MSYEFRSINFSRIFPRLQSIYQPVKLARSLEAASRNEEAKFFINFLGMEMPRVLKEGGSIAEHNERRLESSGRITEQLDSDLWSCSNGNNYIKEHNELVRAIVSVRNPIVSIIGGEISQPTFALATYTPFRIVTEEAILRLGSPTIGFISGLSYMYSRMADDIEFSRFLIMSSATIEPISAIISGIATHYVKSEDIDRLVCSLCSEKAPNILNILSIIDNYSSIPREDDFSAARKMPPCFLSDVNLYKALVDAFSPDSCEEMLEKIHSLLESDIHEDAKPILKSAADSLSKDKRIETIIRLLLIDYARGWDLGKCLDVENYLTPGIINKLVLSHSSLRTMGSLAGVHREMKSTFHKDVVLRFKDTPECSKELPSNPIYHEILDIPSTNDIKMVVTGEMRDSDDYSMEENELQEWFKDNWGFCRGHYTSEDEKIHTVLDAEMDVLGSKGNEEKSIDTEIEVTTDNEDATEERSAELTTYFTNHTYIPSEVRMTVIIEKIKRTVHAYCTKIGSTGSFLKWKH